MNKIIVTGANGQLGYDVVEFLDKKGYNVVGLKREDLDLTDLQNITKVMICLKPDAIIHCAAYTAVDKAEDEIELCEMINYKATEKIIDVCRNLDIPIIYISTDYVFDGQKDSEYLETDITNPINIYGKTKLMGEQIVQTYKRHFIVRISWVFGQNGNNFVDSMIKLSKNNKVLNIIDDQVGSPTYTKDLTPLLADMLESDKYGIYHVTNEGFCSWYEFAKEIFKIKNIDIELNPIKTSEYKTKAKRPLNSKLSKDKLSENGFNNLRSWKDALIDYLM
ncbi:MAG: dTDP-4-dehydrorhamnose reductase [Peptostreptococcaceae bacterium]